MGVDVEYDRVQHDTSQHDQMEIDSPHHIATVTTHQEASEVTSQEMTAPSETQEDEAPNQHWLSFTMAESSSSEEDEEPAALDVAVHDDHSNPSSKTEGRSPPPPAAGGEILPDVVGDLPWICQVTRQAVAKAITQPLRWASARLRAPMSSDELLNTPYRRPKDITLPSTVQRPLEQPSTRPSPPPGPVRIEQLYLDHKYELIVVPWLRRAQQAMEALKNGEEPPRLEKVVLTQDDMPPWARGVVWDTSDPKDCRPVRRSSPETWAEDFPGDKVDPVAIRREAEQLGWHDTDIVDQICGGGFEGRFECPLTTVLAFHHQGVVKPPAGLEHCDATSAGAGFHQVDKVVQHDVSRGWTDAAIEHLPFVPCRVIPRNVVMNLKYRMGDGGGMERFWKPRVTTDDSFPHDGSSMNDATARIETTTELPTPQHLALALAIILDATKRNCTGVGAVLWGLDFSDAYRMCPVQKAEHWAQCFVWTGGVLVERRGVFGAAWMPNRFQRLACLAMAVATRQIEEFDEAVPPPQAIRRWSEERKKRGLGDADAVARFSQIYIDDSLGVSLDDVVNLPPDWAHIHPRDGETRAVEATTRAVGGAPAHPYARGAVHARIAATTYSALGFNISIAKSQAGSKVAALGLRMNVDSERIDCIPHKASALRAEARDLLDAIRPAGVIDGRRLERFVGRVNHVAQVAPEFKQYLRYGYAAINGAKHRSGAEARSRRTAWFRDTSKLKVASRFDPAVAGKSCWLGVRKLLAMVDNSISEVSVPLAPSATFPSPKEGASLVHLDASRIDGCGGWMWVPDQLSPRGWRLVSFDLSWPNEVRTWLSVDVNRLSMPAGELAAVLIAKTMAEAVARARWVIVVTDCAPVEGAVNAMVSPSPQLHELLVATYATKPSTQLLAVHVKREFNEVADELSKGAGEAVRERARQQGFTCERWRVSPQHPVWHALDRAAALPQHP